LNENPDEVDAAEFEKLFELSSEDDELDSDVFTSFPTFAVKSTDDNDEDDDEDNSFNASSY
jgi:hypothetical protein